VAGNNPHVRYHDVEHAGYVMIDITSHALTADFRTIEDRTKADNRISSAAKFTIEADARARKAA
jgi:alkaline phosphatase D